jgi:hypothetical protein
MMGIYQVRRQEMREEFYYYYFFVTIIGVGLTSPGTAATSGLLYSPR